MTKRQGLILCILAIIWSVCGIWLWAWLAYEVEWKKWQELPMCAMCVIYFSLGLGFALMGAFRAGED